MSVTQEFIAKVESIIAENKFSRRNGFGPHFNINDTENAVKIYQKMKGDKIHTEKGFSFMGIRGYSFFKATNETIYVVERYVGDAERVFMVEELFDFE